MLSEKKLFNVQWMGKIIKVTKIAMENVQIKFAIILKTCIKYLQMTCGESVNVDYMEHVGNLI